MTIQEKKLTIEQFWELAQQPQYDNKRLELIDGEVIVMSPSSLRNSEIAATILWLIRSYVAEHKLGRVTGADGAYKVAEDAMLAPDVGFIRHGRLPEEEFVFSPVAPDLAVEVISPSETSASVQRKTRRYLEAGTQVVWNVYPTEKTVDVVTLSDDGNLLTVNLTAEKTIGGGDSLPNFQAEVEAFFS